MPKGASFLPTGAFVSNAANDNQTMPVAPDQPVGSRWAVIMAGIASALSLLGDQAVYVIVPYHYQEMGLRPWHVAIILSVNRFVRLLTNHLVNWLIHRVHSAFLFVGVLVLAAALAFTYGLQPPFVVFVIARVLWGLCWSMIRQIGTMTSIRAMPGQEVGRTVGLYSGLARAGSIAGLALGGFFFDELGLRWCFFALAGISLLGVIPAAAIGKTIKRLSYRHEEHIHGHVPRMSRGLLVCGFLLGCMGYGIIFSKLTDILKTLAPDDTIDLFSLSVKLATFASIVLCTRHVIGLLFGPKLGRLSDRIGCRRSAFGFFMMSMLLLSASTLMAQNFWAIVILMILFFVTTSALIVILMAEAGRASPATFAWLVTALDFGGAVGPLLAWTIGEWATETWIPFAIASGLAAVGTAISLRRMLRSDRAIPATV
ncbi:MAG: MFS transporter [Planctomycetota bacterium]